MKLLVIQSYRKSSEKSDKNFKQSNLHEKLHNKLMKTIDINHKVLDFTILLQQNTKELKATIFTKLGKLGIEKVQ